MPTNGKNILTVKIINSNKNRILILGGSSDIGIELINFFLNNNYIVDSHYNENSLELKKIQKKNSNLKLIRINFDKVDSKNYEKVIKKFFDNNYSSYINLIGYTDNLSFENTNLSSLSKSLKINFLIPFFITQFIVKKMLKRKFGRILNISSIGVKFGGGANNFNYSLSKYNLEFMPSIYKKWAKSNVFINCIRLGVFNTKIHKRIKNKNINKRINLIPIKRMGKSYELIPLINYIISEENSFLTGEVINFSGGE